MKKLSTLLALSVLAVGPAFAGNDPGQATRPRPSYERGKADSRRPVVDRPATPALPSDLHLAPEASSSETAATSAASAEAPVASHGTSRAHAAHGRRPAEPASTHYSKAEQLARSAAAEAAEHHARHVGWWEYYRVGVHRGMRDALSDERIGGWDFSQGMRHGLRDPDAREYGASIGRDAAIETAAPAARERVVGQFRNLDVDPRFAPRSLTPRYTAPTDLIESPRLADVFADNPPQAFRVMPLRFFEAFDGYRHDPWALYQFAAYSKFHDRQWRQPTRAFEAYCADRRTAAAYYRLSAAEQAHFRRVFEAQFATLLPRYFDRLQGRAFNDGFDDGWAYGAILAEEWQYRQGYHEGFNEHAASAAEAAFDANYSVAYDDEYERAFDDWSRNAHPEILGVTLLDENDDGVFEPGESLIAQYEIANYGGRDATLPVRLRGDVLDEMSASDLMLPARAVVTDPQPVEAVIRPGIPADTQAQVGLVVAGQTHRVGLTVAYPLHFAGGVEVERVDAAAGRMTVAVDVANRSRRPTPGTVVLEQVTSGMAPETRPLEIRDGGRGNASFELRNLDPLDVLAGNVRLQLRLEGGSKLYDLEQFIAPDLSRDLDSGELFRFVEATAYGDVELTRAEADELRGLLMNRLRADWDRARNKRGNPYKYDYKKGATSTELGRLVQLAGERELRKSPILAGLESDVLTMCRDLPGMHPFMRKNVRKLAKRLP